VTDVEGSDGNEEFVVCPRTTLYPEYLEYPDGNGGTEVLTDIWVSESNISILCGWDGALQNNCAFVGGKSHIYLTQTNMTDFFMSGFTFTGASETSISAWASPLSNAHFTDCVWKDNSASSAPAINVWFTYDYVGGEEVDPIAMMVKVSNSLFVDNASRDIERGSAILNEGGVLIIENSIFTDNRNGWPVEVALFGTLELTGSCFMNNPGPVYMFEGAVLISNSDNYGSNNNGDGYFCEGVYIDVDMECVEFDATFCAVSIASAPPTSMPSDAPSLEYRYPTQSPSLIPSSTPSVYPSNTPSANPTPMPSVSPTISFQPSHVPTMSPTRAPLPFGVTRSPTIAPTEEPSIGPTNAPSKPPTVKPTTQSPTISPTAKPCFTDWLTLGTAIEASQGNEAFVVCANTRLSPIPISSSRDTTGIIISASDLEVVCGDYDGAITGDCVIDGGNTHLIISGDKEVTGILVAGFVLENAMGTSVEAFGKVGSSAVFRDILWRYNKGGAVKMYHENNKAMLAVFNGCHFYSNEASAGSGLFVEVGYADVRGCTFEANEGGWPIEVVGSSSSLRLQESCFIGNNGGGLVYIDWMSQLITETNNFAVDNNIDAPQCKGVVVDDQFVSPECREFRSTTCRSEPLFTLPPSSSPSMKPSDVEDETKSGSNCHFFFFSTQVVIISVFVSLILL